jgi:hypothetical protein
MILDDPVGERTPHTSLNVSSSLFVEIISLWNRLDEILMAAGEMISDNSAEKAESTPARGDATGSMGVRNVLEKPFL